MPYFCIFVEEVIPLLEAMTDKLVLTFVCGRNYNISNDLVRLQQKLRALNYLLVRVGTFGVGLYRNQ